MIFYEGMTTVNLLEFWEEASSDIARTLEGSKEDLDGFLPSFEILSCGGGEDLAWSSETFVLVYFCDNVEGFSHYEVVLRDGLRNEREIEVKEMYIYIYKIQIHYKY